MHLKFLTWCIKHLTSQTLGEGVQIGSLGKGCNGCSNLQNVSTVVGNAPYKKGKKMSL